MLTHNIVYQTRTTLHNMAKKSFGLKRSRDSIRVGSDKLKENISLVQTVATAKSEVLSSVQLQVPKALMHGQIATSTRSPNAYHLQHIMI